MDSVQRLLSKSSKSCKGIPCLSAGCINKMFVYISYGEMYMEQSGTTKKSVKPDFRNIVQMAHTSYGKNGDYSPNFLKFICNCLASNTLHSQAGLREVSRTEK